MNIPILLLIIYKKAAKKKTKENLTFTDQEHSILPQKWDNGSLICLYRALLLCIAIVALILALLALALALGWVGRPRWLAWFRARSGTLYSLGVAWHFRSE
jgi:hypothetical protein